MTTCVQKKDIFEKFPRKLKKEYLIRFKALNTFKSDSQIKLPQNKMTTYDNLQKKLKIFHTNHRKTIVN